MTMTETGPPVPPSPAPGSNAIGLFAIGISPIGTIIPFNYWETIISEYSNSPVIDALIGDFDQWLDQTYDMEQFYQDIWDVTTAVGYGLDVWGRIVGVSRVISIPVGDYLGFEEQGTTVQSFGFGPFYSGEQATQNYALSDSAFRQLIYAKALFNISNGSIPSINAILRTLFPNAPGNAYCTDGNNMTMTYTFNFQLTPVEEAILTQTGVLPKPTGVSATIVSQGVA